MKSLHWISLIALLACAANARDHFKITSPSGSTEVTLDGGRLVYSVAHHGKTVLKPSPIGAVVEGQMLGTKSRLGDATIRQDQAQFPWRGKKSEVETSWRGVVLPVTESDGEYQWQLEVRCFDDGVAYRCILPGDGSRHVNGEADAWALPEGTFAWCEPVTGHYEGVRVRRLVDKISRTEFTNGIGMPLVFELPDGGFAALTEANVTGYSGMTLNGDGHGHLVSVFLNDPKGWTMSGKIVTPWRVLMVADDLNGLVNCDIVPTLCPPPDPRLFPDGIRTDWLKPGRTLWQWWAYGGEGTHWSRQKGFVDAAAALNCQYYLVDEGWEHTRQEWAIDGKSVWDRLKELCDYAATKHVGIWVWRGWTYEAKRQWPGLETHAKREDFFRRCAEAGVKGAKVDFMNSESHDMLAFYEDCTRVAAEHKIMVNFHGANKPAGEERTWPNEMTREAVRGLEFNKWDALPPVHYATLPFTRYLVGHGDFTPTTFEPQRLKGTTFGGQLATAVIFTSPVLCWADKPEIYLASPAIDLIRTLPTTWDETRVLPGSQIGKLAVFARRSGQDWYVGIFNGPDARDYELALNFLGNGSWKADYYSDAPGKATQLVKEHDDAVTSATKHTLHLASGGGFVARIRR